MRNYLFYRCLVFSALLVSSLTFATPRIIIKDATLIDANNPIRENMTVVLQGDVIVGDPHTPAAAAGYRLHNHGVADLLGDLESFIFVLEDTR